MAESEFLILKLEKLLLETHLEGLENSIELPKMFDRLLEENQSTIADNVSRYNQVLKKLKDKKGEIV